MRNDAFRVDVRLTQGAEVSFSSPHRWETPGSETAPVEEGQPDPVVRRLEPRGQIVGVGHGSDRFAVTSLLTNRDVAVVSLVNHERSSELFGARLTVAAPALFGIILICCQLPQRVSETSLVWRTRRHGARALHGPPTWVARVVYEQTEWVSGGDRLSLSVRQSHYHVLMGRGSPDVARSRVLLTWSLHRIHPEGYDDPFVNLPDGLPHWA